MIADHSNYWPRDNWQTGQTRIPKHNYPTPQPHQPMWKVGPKAHREQGDDACMGFMGLLGVGVHMHQVGYAQLINLLPPMGTIASGGVGQVIGMQRVY